MLTWLLLASHVPSGGSGGGMVRYVVELSRALASTPGIHVHVTSRPSAADWWTEELGSAEQVHVVRDLPVAARSMAERAGWDAAYRRRFDVVHGTKHLLPRRASGLKLLTVHDMLPLDRPHDFGITKRHLLRAPYLASIREADLIVTVSAATADRLCAYVPEAADRIHVTPLAAAPMLIGSTAEPIEALVGRDFVLAVGDQSARKNIPTLVEAWHEVVSRHSQAVLAIAGPPGWGRTALGPEVERLHQAGQITLLGHISEGALRWAYENARAVALPSLLEGFGLPVIEARSFGARLLTSEDPALTEAAAGYGRICFSDSVDSWVSALTEVLSMPRSLSSPNGDRLWTWGDTARATILAVESLRGVGRTATVGSARSFGGAI